MKWYRITSLEDKHFIHSTDNWSDARLIIQRLLSRGETAQICAHEGINITCERCKKQFNSFDKFTVCSECSDELLDIDLMRADAEDEKRAEAQDEKGLQNDPKDYFQIWE